MAGFVMAQAEKTERRIEVENQQDRKLIRKDWEG